MRRERRDIVEPSEVRMAVVALFGQIRNAHRGNDLRGVVQLQARVGQVSRELGVQRAPGLLRFVGVNRHTPPYHS